MRIGLDNLGNRDWNVTYYANQTHRFKLHPFIACIV